MRPWPPGEEWMRVFLAAAVTAAIIAYGGAYILSKAQEPVSVAFTTGGARLDATD
jgi:hypothetical protein